MKRQIRSGILRTSRLLFLMLAKTFSTMAGEVKATSVTAQQRYPWNGLVDVNVTVNCASNDLADVSYVFVATDRTCRDGTPELD